tara:strand:- start:1480 stop:1749 length:270 start_codon:yes stop_codon:yes gene_type:complete
MKSKYKCNYSGLPSPEAYKSQERSILREKKFNKLKCFINKYYPVIIAFVCLTYSVVLGLLGYSEEAMYSAHWPGTILLFSIAINQIKRS